MSTPAYFKNHAEYEAWRTRNMGDFYSECGVGIVETVARIAEKQLAKGLKPEIAFEAGVRRAAKKLSPTGFQMGWAAGALRHFWTRGEEFGAWWNARYSDKTETAREKAAALSAEGRIINPAIIEIETFPPPKQNEGDA